MASPSSTTLDVSGGECTNVESTNNSSNQTEQVDGQQAGEQSSQQQQQQPPPKKTLLGPAASEKLVRDMTNLHLNNPPKNQSSYRSPHSPHEMPNGPSSGKPVSSHNNGNYNPGYYSGRPHHSQTGGGGGNKAYGDYNGSSMPRYSTSSNYSNSNAYSTYPNKLGGGGGGYRGSGHKKPQHPTPHLLNSKPTLNQSNQPNNALLMKNNGQPTSHHPNRTGVQNHSIASPNQPMPANNALFYQPPVAQQQTVQLNQSSPGQQQLPNPAQLHSPANCLQCQQQSLYAAGRQFIAQTHPFQNPFYTLPYQYMQAGLHQANVPDAQPASQQATNTAANAPNKQPHQQQQQNYIQQQQDLASAYLPPYYANPYMQFYYPYLANNNESQNYPNYSLLNAHVLALQQQHQIQQGNLHGQQTAATLHQATTNLNNQMANQMNSQMNNQMANQMGQVNAMQAMNQPGQQEQFAGVATGSVETIVAPPNLENNTRSNSYDSGGGGGNGGLLQVGGGYTGGDQLNGKFAGAAYANFAANEYWQNQSLLINTDLVGNPSQQQPAGAGGGYSEPPTDGVDSKVIKQ